MQTVAVPTPSINLRDTRGRLQDLLDPRPAVYWADMLLSAAVGWGSFAAALKLPPFSAAHLLLCLVASLALYRGAMFIHELTHLSKGSVPGFHAAWELLFGIPLQVPSFMYVGVHLEHHRRTIYGTPQDPEYLPLASGPRWRVAWFLVQAPLIPFLLLARFAILAPLSVVLGPRFRGLVVARASSLVINARFRREPPAAALRKRWIVCEAAASALALAVIVATVFGWLAPALLVQWLAVSAGVAVINQFRTLVAHRWRNDGSDMDVPSQFLDSISTPHPLGALWAPVGLRFHALHHFVPDLPYHALGAAHRRLASDFPAEVGYARTLSRGMFASLSTLWTDAAQSRRIPRASECAEAPAA